jgi:hypothetical protein
MDQKLLDALNNITVALEQLSESLDKSKSGQSKSDVGGALQSGDFSKQLIEINEGIKSIKEDTKKILDNQETIIKLQKQQSSGETKVFEEAGGGKTKQMIKDGVAVIGLIAGAIIAIGLAFKLISGVDFTTVISISIALPLIALAFVSIANVPGLDLGKIGLAAGGMVIMATAIFLSSIPLSYIMPVSAGQALTAIGIAGVFTVLSYGMGKLIKSFNGISIASVLVASALLPVVMYALSYSIYRSSEYLSQVTPVSFSQGLSAIMISGVFSVISFGIGKIFNSLGYMNPVMTLVVAALLPFVLLSVSYAISESSKVLNKIEPIGLAQGITAIMIAGVFAVISFGLGKLFKSFEGLDPATAIVSSIMMPFVLGALSYTIMESSFYFSKVENITGGQFLTSLGISVVFIALSFAVKPILKGVSGANLKDLGMGLLVLIGLTGAIVAASYIINEMADVDEGKLKNFALTGLSLAGAILPMALTLFVISKLGGPSVFLKGAISTVIVAGAIALSSIIINKGEYGNKPDVDWSFGVGSSLLVFGTSALALGLIILASGSLGVQALLFGSGAILGLSLVIVGTSQILSLGNYGDGPDVSWAFGTGLSLVAFGTAALTLGTIILATGGLGAVAIGVGSAAILGISAVIVGTANILSSGNYSGGPGIEWAIGVGGTLIAFATAIVILGVINSVGGLAETLSLGAVKNPIEAGSEAVIMIALTMNKVGDIVSKGNYSGGPTKEWSNGIAIALGAFSPIYQMMVANKVMEAIFGGGVKVEDFATAIETISQGIVSAANFFAGSKTAFTGGPSKEWSEGVGLAIGAFAPVYEILAANSGWLKSGIKPEDFAGTFDKNGLLIKDGAIQVIARGIVSAAKFFGENTAVFDVSLAPSKEWSEKVGGALGAFLPIFNILSENSGFFGDKSIISKLNNGIISISKSIRMSAFWLSKGDYSQYPSKEWVDGITYTIQKLSKINNINSIARTFRTLGSSIKSFSDSISSLELGKLEAIKSLSGSVVLLSLMDPEMFDTVMTKLEEKAPIFNELIKNFESQKETTGSTVNTTTSGGSSPKGPSEIQILTQKIDTMNGLLSDISSVVGSKGTLRDYLASKSDSQLLTNNKVSKSDKRLKNIIRKIGTSLSGINIYEFTYKFNNKQIYQGIIAQELIGTQFENALVYDKNGYYAVDYSKIDVVFKKLNKVE